MTGFQKFLRSKYPEGYLKSAKPWLVYYWPLTNQILVGKDYFVAGLFKEHHDCIVYDKMYTKSRMPKSLITLGEL